VLQQHWFDDNAATTTMQINLIFTAAMEKALPFTSSFYAFFSFSFFLFLLLIDFDIQPKKKFSLFLFYIISISIWR
jgi:hypothetical protein